MASTGNAMQYPRNRHRVVVQLIDKDTDEEFEEIPKMLRSAARASLQTIVPNPPVPVRPARSAGYPDLEVVDAHTVKMTVNALHPLKMQFDCVGSASDPHVQAELTALVVKLIANQCDCCLVRFQVMRECSKQFICQRLFREIDTQLGNARAKLVHVHMEYYDLRKYEVVKMLTPRFKISPQSKDCPSTSRLTFGTVLDLMHWFQNKYYPLWSAGIANEFFEFSFNLIDSNRRQCHVKLSLMLNYLNKLDFDTKFTLTQFWETLAYARRMKHSMLTDCLKEFYAPDGKCTTWTFFSIPIIYGGGMLVEDMLMLANSANTGLRKMYAEKETKVQKLARLGGGSTNEFSAFQKLPATLTRHLSEGDDIMAGMDRQNLSYWYNKVDVTFKKAVTFMEDYYYHLSERKIAQMCADIRQMLHGVEEKQPAAAALSFKAPAIANEDYAQYKDAMVEFKQLGVDIARTTFEPLLRVHLKTKTFDLQQRIMRFKVRLLQQCQSCLTTAIKKEMAVLNELKLSPVKMINKIIE